MIKIREEWLEHLSEEIMENIEWFYTYGEQEIECISIENLQTILSNFFERKIKLSLT